MQRYLITGFSGFVARHFLSILETESPSAVILGLDANAPDFSFANNKNIQVDFKQIDMLDRNKLESIIKQFNPDYILHLASCSSVAKSWKFPENSFINNTNIFLNLLESVRLNNIKCRILSVGSSEEYGNVTVDAIPLEEETRVNPTSPYAVARVSQEMLSHVYAKGYGLDVVMTRSFNHIGPYQRDIFVVSSFAKQLVEIAEGIQKEHILYTGDISVMRDFVDVRDVVNAYYLLFRKGISGEVYNICSGNGVKLSELILLMTKTLDLKVDIRQKESLVRPTDNRVIVGSNVKIVKAVDWRLNYTLSESIRDIINFWKMELS